MKKVDTIIDMQFGSTGKGLFASYLGLKNNYEAVISINQPNAGHTAYDRKGGNKFIHKVLPSAIFHTGLQIIGIGPGSVFDVNQLTKELEWATQCGYLKNVTLLIHECAVLVTNEHRQREQQGLSSIASTMQGSAAASIDKMMRKPSAIAKANQDKIRLATQNKMGIDVIIVSNSEWLQWFTDVESILVEGSQGFSLGINAGFYPYCTSRDCTPARTLAEAGIPVQWLRHVYGTARTYPIRVGNTPDGTSGGWYHDQKEVTFEELGVETETTTVTGRPRRIATFSSEQIRQAMIAIQPDFIFLNFIQYPGAKELCRIMTEFGRLSLETGTGTVGFMGRSPYHEDIEDITINEVQYDGNTLISDLQKSILDWVDGVLPDRDPLPAALKLAEESAELSAAVYGGDDMSVKDELADIFIVAIDLAHMLNVDITRIVKGKLEKNKEHTWGKKDGLLKRIK